MMTPNSIAGIFLPDDFLADKRLSLEEKVLFLIIKRELESTGKYFTTTLTDPRLSKLTGISLSTIQRKLRALEEKGYIATVSLNRAANRATNRGDGTKGKQPKQPKQFKPSQPAIKGIRFIYLDKKLAGYRRRAINKAKRPVEFLYSMLVLEGGMSPQAYVARMKKERLLEHQAEEVEEKRRHNEEFMSSLVHTSDEDIALWEQSGGVEPGTYLKRKQEYLAELKKYEGDDGLFD